MTPKPREDWPAPPPERCLVCGAAMPDGPDSGVHSAGCDAIRKGAPGIGRPVRSVWERRGAQAFHPSLQQLVDTANRVQQVRNDDALVHPFTVEQLAIIGWALGIATAELVQPTANTEATLQRLTARLERLEQLVHGGGLDADAAPAKGGTR
jgi:hypothetical protein